MSDMPSSPKARDTPAAGRGLPAWRAALAEYRKPGTRQASIQLLDTLGPYVALWVLAVLSIRHGYPYAVTFAIQIVAAAFLVRIFILFHDCVHGSLFPGKAANTVCGHVLGVLTFTPFDDWRFSHLRHHATYADLDARGFGDIWVLTRTEYEASSRRTKLAYRLYRNPLVLIGLGAIFTFLLRFRLPTRTTKRKERMSVLFTNLIIVGVALIAGRFMGWKTYLLIQIPVIWMAGAAGIWLFYVQHQFEGGYWARRREWDALRAAMEGCSFYRLPTVLRWFSANIGYHHIHHLNARIPNYRLKECFEAVPQLQAKAPVTIRNSLSAVRLKLWDEERKRFSGFRPNTEGGTGATGNPAAG